MRHTGFTCTVDRHAAVDVEYIPGDGGSLLALHGSATVRIRAGLCRAAAGLGLNETQNMQTAYGNWKKGKCVAGNGHLIKTGEIPAMNARNAGAEKRETHIKDASSPSRSGIRFLFSLLFF